MWLALIPHSSAHAFDPSRRCFWAASSSFFRGLCSFRPVQVDRAAFGDVIAAGGPIEARILLLARACHDLLGPGFPAP